MALLFVFFAKYNQEEQVKESEMSRAPSTNVGKGVLYKILVRIRERKRQL
jgi:hypothetical protein